MKAIYGMYPVLPNPRKKVAKGYYYIQNKILAPSIIINRIGAKISNSSIVRTRVFMTDGGKTDANSAKHMCTTHRVNAPSSQHMCCEHVLKHIV